MVVDDDQHIVALLVDLLEGEGHDVASFTSSTEAVGHLADQPADLLITDINMPDVTGMDLLRAVRQRSPGTVVIMITAYSTLESTLEAVELGAFDYLTKPFMVGEVKLIVQRGLEQRRLQGENLALGDRVSHLEVEIHRLEDEFRTLRRSLKSPGEPSKGPAPHQMPALPRDMSASHAYARATHPPSSLADRLDLLEDLHQRGVLSAGELDRAKLKLRGGPGA